MKNPRPIDHSNDRKYFTIIPNIIIDSNLTVYEFALYCHLKRTAGDQGKCWKGLKTLSGEMGCSVGSTSKARQGLEAKGFVAIVRPADKRKAHEITITDKWPANIVKYSQSPGDRSLSYIDNELSSGEYRKEPSEEEQPDRSPSVPCDTGAVSPPLVSDDDLTPHRESGPKAGCTPVQGLTPETLATLFNEINDLHGSPLPRAVLTPQRKKKATTRLKKHPNRAFWESVFVAATTDPFYSGADGKWNGMNFGWPIYSEEQAVRLFERATKAPRVRRHFVHSMVGAPEDYYSRWPSK